MAASSSRLAPVFRDASFFCALSFFGCGSHEDEGALRSWYGEVDQVEVAQVVDREQDGLSTQSRMRAAGFTGEPDNWRREAALTASPTLQPLSTGAMQHVGAVSVLSIDRHNGQPPYLYATLRSLFAELAEGEPVNVFVGDDQLAYVEFEALTRELGEDWAARVNVIGSASADVAYMREQNFSVWERATWNYARMLRAYTGPHYHLTFEDDVLLSRGSLQILDGLSHEGSAAIVSLYNANCERTPGAQKGPADGARVVSHRHHRSKKRFWGTQGVAYRGTASARVGRSLQARLGEEPFDLLVDSYMRHEKMTMGYMLPSVVQHMGALTTGLGFHHVSSCFVDDYPAPAPSAP